MSLPVSPVALYNLKQFTPEHIETFTDETIYFRFASK